ncbi:MAG: hypothetical protein GTO02_06025, partial [Candidatus Dadabacteria bacterium]|nr:hypothetical protein [Candidatus Dadabacteria bacterium]
MVDKLRSFNNIIVTGPGRSGTRICSKILAKDLGYEVVEEATVNAQRAGIKFGSLKKLVPYMLKLQ